MYRMLGRGSKAAVCAILAITMAATSVTADVRPVTPDLNPGRLFRYGSCAFGIAGASNPWSFMAAISSCLNILVIDW